jgi:Domain of unknown function (DUF4232)
VIGCGGGERHHGQPAAVTRSPCAGTFSVRHVAGQGGFGNLFAVFSVNTTAPATCVLRGYPRLTLLDAHRRPLPTHAKLGGIAGSGAVPRVSLRRGHSGHFFIVYEWHDLSGRHLCKPRPSWLRVRLPGDDRDLTVWLRRKSPQLRYVTPCGGRFDVSPLLNG